MLLFSPILNSNKHSLGTEFISTDGNNFHSYLNQDKEALKTQAHLFGRPDPWFSSANASLPPCSQAPEPGLVVRIQGDNEVNCWQLTASSTKPIGKERLTLQPVLLQTALSLSAKSSELNSF